jgi:hypothetical protein
VCQKVEAWPSSHHCVLRLSSFTYLLHNVPRCGEQDTLALKALSLEEAKARRDRLSKMRALLFYHELKSKRLKKIKSKEFHRQAQKAAARVCCVAWFLSGCSSCRLLPNCSCWWLEARMETRPC